MKTKSENLILELIEVTRQNLNFAELLKAMNNEQLNWKENKESWSVLECLEHLNLYGDYYLPEIKKAIENTNSNNVEYFESGFLGNYFANSMLPKEKLNKMKTFKDKNPLNSKLDRETIDRFISQQQSLIELLNKSKSVNLNGVKITVSISKWIKLKLGDTFRFIINHNLRHIKQIENVQLKMGVNV
ncbi:DinB family protein [Flavobacterium aestivum]|uniref:DinB family protein n=1 Tax=Flavobacterium aestivum TaxID=3003257 RepID=UPI002286AEEB|nr:DinB family protein [Flavobacterium aestivum]